MCYMRMLHEAVHVLPAQGARGSHWSRRLRRGMVAPAHAQPLSSTLKMKRLPVLGHTHAPWHEAPACARPHTQAPSFTWSVCSGRVGKPAQAGWGKWRLSSQRHVQRQLPFLLDAAPALGSSLSGALAPMRTYAEHALCTHLTPPCLLPDFTFLCTRSHLPMCSRPLHTRANLPLCQTSTHTHPPLLVPDIHTHALTFLCARLPRTRAGPGQAPWPGAARQTQTPGNRSCGHAPSQPL